MASTADGDELARAVEEDVAALTARIERERPQVLPLDRTYASLDRIEDFYRSLLEAAADGGKDVDAQVASYVGATLAAATGGRWQAPRTKADMGRAAIVGLPHLTRARFYPLDVVRTFRRTRSAGYMRDATEIYDIPRRRAELERLVADSDAVIARLRADLADILGRDPATLDGGRASIEMIENAFKQLVASNASPDLMRRVENGALMYLGEIARRAVGGEWTVSEDPDADDVGQFRMHGWAPVMAIRNVGPQSRPNILQAALDLAIKGRSGK
jgi:hypothetical protein